MRPASETTGTRCWREAGGRTAPRPLSPEKGNPKMATTFLVGEHDMCWLREVHGAPEGFACALLHGNEDYPERIDLWRTNTYGPPDQMMTRDPKTGELK